MPNAYGQLTKADLDAFKAKYPERFAKLEQRIRFETTAEREAQEAAERAEREAEFRRRTGIQRMRIALADMRYPHINFNTQGILAYRSWSLDAAGYLISPSYKARWSTEMTADDVPSEFSHHGLYAYKLTPKGFMSLTNYSQCEIRGIVELRGKVIEHDDGTFRAQTAIIRNLFVVTNERTCADVYAVLPKLYEHYPDVEITVLFDQQLTDILFFTTAELYQRQKGM